MLAVTVDTRGKMLPSMLIVKGMPNKCISSCELITYQDHTHYACQKKVWMYEEMMDRWIYFVLIPSKNLKVPDIIPILIHDAY
jgi:hypothetical protein